MMETDRELLELAALAANQERSIGGDLWSNARGRIWNPLDDDGDALRLAVKLKIDLHIYLDHASATSVAFDESQHYSCFEKFDKDQCASVRRAIVRSAAEIGRSMNRIE